MMEILSSTDFRFLQRESTSHALIWQMENQGMEDGIRYISGDPAGQVSLKQPVLHPVGQAA